MKPGDIQKIIDNVIDNLKDRWDFYRHAAYLKKMGWTEEAYQKQTDPDYDYKATRIKDCYHGYPYLIVFLTSRGDPWTRFPTWIDGYAAIEEWCKENCEEKWRSGIHKVIQNYWDEWEENDIGGGDVLFFAFKSQEDAVMFKLNWGGG